MGSTSGRRTFLRRGCPAAVRERLLVGRSTHTLAQAAIARDEPCDYVAFGPIFGTTSKDSPYDARGLAALRAVVAQVSPKPVVAIGGIDASGAAEAVRAGAAGVAVISAVAAADDPAAAACALALAAQRAGSAGGHS